MIDGINATEAVTHTIPANLFELQNNQKTSDQNLSQSIQSDLNADRPITNFNVDSTRGTNADLSIGKQVMLNITEMDADYKSAMQRLNDWPSFDSYLEKRGLSLEEEMKSNTVGLTHITNIEDPQSKELGSLENNSIENNLERMEAMQEKFQAVASAGNEYSQDSIRWYVSTEFWLSKVKILTSAVSQVSNGLRTLFTSQ